MKILITGAAGQLGKEILRQLNNGKSALGEVPQSLQKAQIIAVDLADANLANRAQTKALLQKNKPDVVINCAAFTNVDACETEKDTAFAANAIAPRNLAIECELIGAKLVHVSTDYVFNGTASEPLTEAEPSSPKSVYGKTKHLGEEYVKAFCSRWFIVRTAWLYGKDGNNFVKTMLHLAKTHDTLKVVEDQMGNPTNAEDLAHHLLKLSASEEYGIYHATCEGTCSWYDFTREIMRLAKLNNKLLPCTTKQFPRPAKRPAYSALDNAMLRATIGSDMRTWQNALASFFEGRTIEDILM